MVKLNLPEYHLKISQKEGRPYIFDEFRKKHIVLTPEEWVRQNFLMYLIVEKKFPRSLVAVEAGLKLYKRKKRTDAVVYNKQGEPLLIIECKSPEVKISQNVFDQIARYNLALMVNYLIVTNGLEHYCCSLDYENNSYSFLSEIPLYEVLLENRK